MLTKVNKLILEVLGDLVDMIVKVYRQIFNWQVSPKNITESIIKDSMIEIWNEIKPVYEEWLSDNGYKGSDGINDYLMKNDISMRIFITVLQKLNHPNEMWEIVNNFIDQLNRINDGDDMFSETSRNEFIELIEENKKSGGKKGYWPDQHDLLDFINDLKREYVEKNNSFNRPAQKIVDGLEIYIDKLDRLHKIPMEDLIVIFDQVIHFTTDGKYSGYLLRDLPNINFGKLRRELDVLGIENIV